jgi:hypothetical protein
VPLVLYGSQYPGGKAINRLRLPHLPPGSRAISDLTEKLGLRFRGEFFNLFNHPNFGSPENTLGDLLFGQSTQTLANSMGTGGANGGFNPLYQIGGPRSIQLALKLQFQTSGCTTLALRGGLRMLRLKSSA